MSPQRERQLKLQADGKCIVCAKPRGDNGTQNRCSACREKHNQSQVDCRARLRDRKRKLKAGAR